MKQGKPDNLNVHNCHMSVPIYGAAIECDVRCVEISQLYDLIILIHQTRVFRNFVLGL